MDIERTGLALDITGLDAVRDFLKHAASGGTAPEGKQPNNPLADTWEPPIDNEVEIQQK